jgi:Phosphotransferase enzyme family
MGTVAGGSVRPDESVASAIAREFSGSPPKDVSRFATGIGHWVYDVRTSTGETFVVRVGTPDQAPDFAGAVHWSRMLRPLGVPLPSLLASGAHQRFPYVILARLPGVDLGLVYPTLDLAQKQAIASEVFGAQNRVAALGEGPGYGYLRLPSDPCRGSWRAVIDDSIGRSRSRIEAAQSLAPEVCDRVSRSADQLDAYFSRVRPTPFLDDATTKNVLVHRGAISGIVDVDWLCFGDPLLTVGLTRASLLSAGRDSSYTDHWTGLIQPSSDQLAALRFYTALFYLDFMSELGHRFNRDTPTITPAEVERLKVLLDDELRGW